MFGDSTVQAVMETYGVTEEGARQMLQMMAELVPDVIRGGGRVFMLTSEEVAELDASARSGDEISPELAAKLLEPGSDLLGAVMAELTGPQG